jgi:CRP-like cAMP-binding protein
MDTIGRSRNGFLRELRTEDYEAIRPHLKTSEFSAGLSLIKLGQPVTHVYFPLTFVFSLVVDLEAGQMIEAAMVGHDSVLGAFSALGKPIALTHAMVLLPGSASVIEVCRLRDIAAQSLGLRDALIHHGQALFVQAQQSAGCNASHSVEARLARWLLRIRDLCGSDIFNLTQEMTAHMIGARRNSVSFIANLFQRNNLIRYSRGQVEILNLPALENIACECYDAVKAQFERLQLPARAVIPGAEFLRPEPP